MIWNYYTLNHEFIYEGGKMPYCEFTGYAVYKNDTEKTISWWKNGIRHREGGPAIEWPDGEKRWFINGKLHREDGPAVELPDGYKEYWLDNSQYTKESYNLLCSIMKLKNINWDTINIVI